MPPGRSRHAIGSLNAEFFGDVKDVVCQPGFWIPVDEVDGETPGIARDRLGQTLSRHEQVVDLFVGPHQPVVNDVLQGLNGGLDNGRRARNLLHTGNSDWVYSRQLLILWIRA